MTGDFRSRGLLAVVHAHQQSVRRRSAGAIVDRPYQQVVAHGEVVRRGQRIARVGERAAA